MNSCHKMLRKTIFIWIISSISFVYVIGKDVKHRQPSKISECLQCKAYSDSFNNWLEKTSRGKFEGGDAAWEESKLKAYARSEVRLVEIQENLCSELNLHKDECYSIAEQAEHLVERWWFEEIDKSSDLYTWLCMDILKFCCPKNHFGESCESCPLQGNKICSGHGICNGEGTRKGDGSCICNKGYKGELCDQCELNYFNGEEDECKPCHKACQECFSYGPDRCKVCASGWQLQDGICSDINECTSSSICKSNQFCVNNIGSYRCLPCDKSCSTCSGLGPYNCTSCKPNDRLWSGQCMDDKTTNAHLSSADKRLFLYVSLNTLMYLFYQKAKPLAVVMGASLSILIFKLESVSDITVIDTVKNYVIIFLKANELL
ncbi:cysteine-rich with EGF-like domain protein 2 [Colias croceus]|uniref:cysteine-rich with EGF-like domain protein 2 n=1 Tax=Colias crocea TaxID=72248 RepID=UPI001E27E5AE|nr:cysteine-rich with EGF-like domain protein 2 [Colias croceus]